MHNHSLIKLIQQSNYLPEIPKEFVENLVNNLPKEVERIYGTINFEI